MSIRALEQIIDRALLDGWQRFINPRKPVSAIKRLKRIYQGLQLQDEDWPITYSPNMDWLERFIFDHGPDLPASGTVGLMVAMIIAVILIGLFAR